MAPRDHGYADNADSYPHIPEMVKKFLPYFRSVINKGLIFEIQNMYENSFPKLSEDFFDKTLWPDESEVAPLVDNDTVSFPSFFIHIVYLHLCQRLFTQ